MGLHQSVVYAQWGDTMSYVYWPEERMPCGYRDPDTEVQCLAPVQVVALGRLALYEEGPQGGTSCAKGHQRWVWPSECRVAGSEGEAIRYEQLMLFPW